MTLQELINFEEKCLQFEVNNKFNMSFNDYIKFNKYLNEIGKITTQYFQLIEQFDKELIKNGLTKEEYRSVLTQYNDKLLNENVICDTHQCVNLIEKYEKINI